MKADAGYSRYRGKYRSNNATRTIFMDWKEFRQLRTELKRPLIMAHRGASAIMPENTLSSFRRAIDDGADIIETDLHFTKDDEIVLMHDSTLDRTVDATGHVRDYTLSQLKKFKIKQSPSEQNREEHIPTLKELIEFTNAQIPLALELKDPLFDQAFYGEKLITILSDSGLLGRCTVISFNKSRLKLVEGLAPSLMGGWITMSNIWPVHPVEFLGPFWPLLIINPLYVLWAHKLGKIVTPLDPTPERRLGLYLRLGVDVILSDNPGLTLREIERRLASQTRK